jgi:signal transduction histidine kinase
VGESVSFQRLRSYPEVFVASRRRIAVQSFVGLDPVFVGYVAAFGLASVACFASLTRTSGIEDADTRRGLQWLLGLSGTWAAAHVAFLTLPGTTPKLVAYYVGLTVGFAAVGAWLYFCSAYTGRSLHRASGCRRAAVATFLAVVAVKYTNPLHGLYFTATPATTPFPHLSVEHHLLHWLAMGLSYAVATVGYFVLLELFTQTGYDTRPLVVLVGLTGLPVVFDVAGLQFAGVVDMTYEPLGVAVFAVGTLFLFHQRFRVVQLAGTVDDPVVFLDADGRVRDANRAAVELFPALAESVGEPFADAVPALADRLDGGDRIFELEVDGDPRYYLLSTNPFTFGSTQVGRLVLVTDVTRTEQYRREIERQNERLEEFASVVSHDLRNPLNVATGRVDLERRQRDSENLEAAARALDRMDRLVSDVLTLARQGQDIGEVAPVSLATVAERAWESVDAPDATLEVVGDGSFYADETRLRQLFENLLRNAVEHAASDVTVTVDWLVADEDADVAPGFYVADDGPGIPPGEREAVFEFGYSAAPEGSGLGLTIVETIAEAHGWTVVVTESETGGACFEFRGVDPA